LDNLRRFQYCVYFPEPQLCLKEIDKLQYKRILVHWQSTNVASAQLFENHSYIYHICHDQETYSALRSTNLSNIRMFSSPSIFKQFLDSEDYMI
jgi:hypothetical protein